MKGASYFYPARNKSKSEVTKKSHLLGICFKLFCSSGGQVLLKSSVNQSNMLALKIQAEHAQL